MKKKKLITIAVALSVVILAIVVSWPLPFMLLVSIYSYLKALLSNTSLWLNVGTILGAVLALTVLIAFVLPTLIYFVKKLYIYASLAILCASSGYEMKIKRPPFSSLKKMSCIGDITIKKKNKVFHIHFIDIIFANRRALTIPNDSEYVITPVTPSRITRAAGGQTPNISRQGTVAFIDTEHSLDKNSDKVKKFPLISPTNKEEHILLIPITPVELKFKGSDSNTFLASGQKIGAMTFCNVDYLKKGLKNKLHSSIFNNQGGRL